MSATATAEPRPLDIAAAQALAMSMTAHVTAAGMGVLTVVGDRLGLFDVLAKRGPLSAEGFAEEAGIHPRYALEWLSAMACHGYVTYHDEAEAFSMTPEQAFCLADQDSPLYLTSVFAVMPDYYGNLDVLTDAFQDGGGVPQDRFGHEWRCGFERFSRTPILNNLAADWIPAMPAIEARLRAGGRVADVGCGNGQAAILMAQAYPAARVVGFDFHAPSIESARANAEAAGVTDRVRFEVLDAAAGIPGAYDLITCFDVVHDMPHPVAGLRGIRQALAPGGSLFVLEFNLSGDLRENIDHPFGIGAFGYQASVNYCMTTALAAGGVGTGTCMGERRFREFAAAAGFAEVVRHDFPNNPLNLFFEARA
jgi:2-polyprenyl-3-methyl-5-hydroxy-6-metoxy-1,4-benzoquinol methylase